MAFPGNLLSAVCFVALAFTAAACAPTFGPSVGGNVKGAIVTNSPNAQTVVGDGVISAPTKNYNSNNGNNSNNNNSNSNNKQYGH